MVILKKTNTLFILALVSLFFCAACKQKTKNTDMAIVFQTISENKTHSTGSKKAQLNCNLKISFVYPESGKMDTSQLKLLQKVFIEKVFAETYADLPPQIAVDSFANQYIRNFNELRAEDFYDDDHDDGGDHEGHDHGTANDEVLQFYLNVENKITYYRQNFISFVVEKSDYAGGAHGSHSIDGYVVDLNTCTLLTEDDFAGNNYTKHLSSIILRKITEANGLNDAKQLENVGYFNINDIVPNGNFTLDDQGITYYFNEYEIAAYSIGITKVFIPYEEFKIYIAENSPISTLAGL